MRRDTNIVVAVSMAAVLLSVGGTVLVVTLGAHHAPGYDPWTDPLILVGIAAVVLGTYILLKTYAFPALPWFEVRTRDRIKVEISTIDKQLSPEHHEDAEEDVALVHIAVVNDERDDVRNATVNAIAKRPFLAIRPADPRGYIDARALQTPGTMIMPRDEDERWIQENITFVGHGAQRDYYFRLRLPSDEDEADFVFRLVSGDLFEPVEETKRIFRIKQQDASDSGEGDGGLTQGGKAS